MCGRPSSRVCVLHGMQGGPPVPGEHTGSAPWSAARAHSAFPCAGACLHRQWSRPRLLPLISNPARSCCAAPAPPPPPPLLRCRGGARPSRGVPGGWGQCGGVLSYRWARQRQQAAGSGGGGGAQAGQWQPSGIGGRVCVSARLMHTVGSVQPRLTLISTAGRRRLSVLLAPCLTCGCASASWLGALWAAAMTHVRCCWVACMHACMHARCPTPPPARHAEARVEEAVAELAAKYGRGRVRVGARRGVRVCVCVCVCVCGG